jgi:hypothetical protein
VSISWGEGDSGGAQCHWNETLGDVVDELDEVIPPRTDRNRINGFLDQALQSLNGALHAEARNGVRTIE